MNKIAFCFLIYDEIIHEELWNIFFKNIDSNKYSIYIHYKYNKPLKYFEKYKINDCIQTKYEDHSIPLAYNILFRNAYKDSENYKFIILSGSCLPFKSFDFIYKKLTKDNYGYFAVCPEKQCFPNCSSLLKYIPLKYIAKSSNWFILNRTLVENLCFNKDDVLKNIFNKIYAPAEYFYYTFIKVLNLEDQIILSKNNINATTFANWEGNNNKYPSTYGLKNYDFISEEEMLYMLNSNCLFARKFTKQCSDCFNDKYISYITSKNSNFTD